MLKKFIAALIISIMLLSLVSIVGVKAQTISAEITSKSFDGENYILKGHIIALDLNPEGQMPEDDDVTIYMDIMLKDGGKWPVLPDGYWIRSGEVKNKKVLTAEELSGTNCKTVSLWSWAVRRRAWGAGAGTNANGGFSYDASKVQDTYKNDFEIKIPKTYADKIVRIRVFLNHSWGGPFAAWPAFSYHHTILYTGKLKEIVAGKPKETPEEIMKKLHGIITNTIKSLRNKAKEKDAKRKDEGMHVFPNSKIKPFTAEQKKEQEKTEQKIKDIATKKKLKVVTIEKPDGSKKPKITTDQKIGFWDKVKYYGSKFVGKASGDIPGVKYISDKTEDWTFKATGLDPIKKTQIDLGVDHVAANLYNQFNRFDSAEKKISSLKTFVNAVSSPVVKPISYVIDKLGLSAKQRTAVAYETEYKTFIKQVKENSGQVNVVKKDAKDTGSLTNKWIFDPSNTATNGSKGDFKDIGKRIDYYIKIAKERGDLPK